MRIDEKFRGQKITYYVDEEKRTVVAVLKVNPYDAALEIVNAVNKSLSPYLVTLIPKDTSFLVNDTYMGKAICHEEDTWNLEKGKEIARLKALRTFTIERGKLIEIVEKSFESALERVEKAKQHSDYTLNHIVDKLNEE